jgi:Leucine-rich repeat (LRR) protein
MWGKEIRLSVVLFSALVVATYAGCQRSQTNTPTPVPTASKPNVREGRLLYFSGRFGAPRLTSIPGFLKSYSDDELRTVTELNLADNDIVRIEGLKRLPNLKTLDLGKNKIETISGLVDAPKLEVLNLTQNRITRIEGLESVTGLRELYLDFNRIEKIESLSHLRNLGVLTLNWNRIRKLEGLRDLGSLWWLEVGANQLDEFSELLELKNVRSLTVVGPKNVIDEEDRRVFREWNLQHPEEQLDSEGAPLSAKKPKRGS